MKRSRLKAISKKRAHRIANEQKARNNYLRAHPYCEAKRAGIPLPCFGNLHIHEPLTRAQGGATGDPQNMKVCCDFHNRQLSQDVESIRWGFETGFRRKSRAA